MKHYALLIGIMLSVVLGLFGLAGILQIPLLMDPSPLLQRGGLFAGATGISLLIIDVVLPVPASLVMIIHGALFGLWLGTLLSTIGSLGAGLFAFFIGRRGDLLLARFIPADERARGDAILARWGELAVLVTRPIPMVAETVAILAGTSPMSWKRMTWATLAGSMPSALLYALIGTLAVSVNGTFWTFVLVFTIASIFWVVVQRVGNQP